jgi:hypothetical protein
MINDQSATLLDVPGESRRPTIQSTVSPPTPADGPNPPVDPEHLSWSGKLFQTEILWTVWASNF